MATSHRPWRRPLLVLLILVCISSTTPVFAFDASDSAAPKIVSSRVLSIASKASDVIVVQLETRDDKNWVTVKPRMSSIQYTFDNVALPICNVNESLASDLHEISRKTLQNGDKQQVFWLTFLSPRVSQKSGCQPLKAQDIRFYTNLCGADGDVFLYADVCIDIRDEVGRESSEVVMSKFLPGRRVVGSPVYSQIFLDATYRRLCISEPGGKSLLEIDAQGKVRNIDSYIDAMNKYGSLMSLTDLSFAAGRGVRLTGPEMKSLLEQYKVDYALLSTFQQETTISNFAKLRVCSADTEAELQKYGRPDLVTQEWATGYLAVVQKMVVAFEAKTKAEAEAKAKAEAEADARAVAEAEVRAKAEAAAKVAASKRMTITCVKGKTVKRVTAANPKCPKGYKKRQ